MPQPTILTAPEAREILRLDDEGHEVLLRDTVLPAVDELIEGIVGWVASRERVLELDGRTTLLPCARVVSFDSAQLRDGTEVDVAGFRVSEAGVLTNTGAALPRQPWTLTVTGGFEEIPKSIKLAAGEVGVNAWENLRNDDPKPFVLSYRAEAWLSQWTPGAVFA